MFPAISKIVLPREIFDGGLTVAHDRDLRGQLRLFRRAFEEEDIVFIVFNQQDRDWLHCYARFNSTQNRLPLPRSESTPTFPPMRSTAFLTMARPMPVPS